MRCTHHEQFRSRFATFLFAIQSVFEFVAPELDRLLDGKEAPVFSTRLGKRSAGSGHERPGELSEPLAERYRRDGLQSQACELQQAYVLVLKFSSF